MSKIHPTAIIGKDVEIGEGTSVGPSVIIEDHVKIGHSNTLRAGVYIGSHTEIGNGNDIHMNAIIGHHPQDLSYENSVSYTRIGHNNIIREFVTIHKGTKAESSTLIGNSNYIMAYCHIAHNCELGNHITLVNQASLSGHCVVEDSALISGMTGLHQFTRVGKLSLLSALSAVNKDIPPYVICGGRPAVVLGLNVVGMRRAGISQEVRQEIKNAYKLVYRSNLNVQQALEEIKKSHSCREVMHFVSFIENSKRGILDAMRDDNQETLQPKKINS